MENTGCRLLLAEDDALMREAVTDYFASKGWITDTASNGVKALEKAKKGNYHLILLDVMMPGPDGFSVCRRIRKGEAGPADIPVIFITARAMEEDELNGYALGADDYVVKPFSLPVLYDKAQVMIKRSQNRRNGEGENCIMEKEGKCDGFLQIRGIHVDETIRQVTSDGRICCLPPMEYEMLVFFMKHPDRIFSRDQLLIRFWGYDFDGNPRVVDNHIKKLRRALGKNGEEIRTARKSGYWMKGR